MVQKQLYNPFMRDEVISMQLRDVDKLELQAATNLSPKKALAQALDTSSWAYVFYTKHGNVGAVAGLYKVKNIGVPWALATDEAFNYPVTWLKEGFKLVNKMVKECLFLSNFIYVNNFESISWLKRLGFNIHTEQTMTIYDDTVPFYHFFMDGEMESYD